MKEFRKPLVILLIGVFIILWSIGIAVGTMVFWNSCIVNLFSAVKMKAIGFTIVSVIAFFIGCIIMKRLLSSGKGKGI